MRVGIITYDANHLKTEQVFRRISGRHDYVFFLLPYTQRTQRPVLFEHRPDQRGGIATRRLAEEYGVAWELCAQDVDIEPGFDYYLVLGAGILSAGCVSGKRILNCHPGVIPAVRGLDAFKWAVYDGQPLGVTLHFIDEALDAGQIVSIVETPVLPSDSLGDVAARHYETELSLLSDFETHLANPRNPFVDIREGEPKRRMDARTESEMLKRFEVMKTP